MSDYGISLSIKKKDAAAFTGTEVSLISKGIGELKGSGDYLDALGEEFIFSLGVQEAEILVLLAEYWIGEETEEEMLDFTLQDKDTAEEITAILNQKFPGEYEYEVYHGAW